VGLYTAISLQLSRSTIRLNRRKLHRLFCAAFSVDGEKSFITLTPGGLDNFSGGGHHLSPMNQFNDFASNGYRPQQQQQQQQQHSNHLGHHPFVTSPTENHLGPQLRHQQHHQQHSHHLMDKTSKDWQDGLRALLPNVNVSFGALPNQPDGLHTPPANGGRMFSSPPLNDHHHHNHHDRLPHRQHTGQVSFSIVQQRCAN
jgi:hypothetical protein